VSEPFRVIALIAAYNEGDIIAAVISHLAENGVDTYLIDHCSTDDTVAQAKAWHGRGLIGVETFPHESGYPAELENVFAWDALLRRKEELSRTLEADWFMHHDADEIREGPWPHLNLRDSIRWVDALGFNCIDFKVLEFCAVDDGFTQGTDPRSYFCHYEEASEFDRIQRKCWKAGKSAVSLTTVGGHDVEFEGRRIFPIQFLLRHYRIRGETHGRRKVFAERLPRFSDRERQQGWHVQYDALASGASLTRHPATLRRFDIDAIRFELQLHNHQASALEQALRGERRRTAATDQEPAEQAGNDGEPSPKLTNRLDALAHAIEAAEQNTRRLASQQAARSEAVTQRLEALTTQLERDDGAAAATTTALSNRVDELTTSLGSLAAETATATTAQTARLERLEQAQRVSGEAATETESRICEAGDRLEQMEHRLAEHGTQRATVAALARTVEESSALTDAVVRQQTSIGAAFAHLERRLDEAGSNGAGAELAALNSVLEETRRDLKSLGDEQRWLQSHLGGVRGAVAHVDRSLEQLKRWFLFPLWRRVLRRRQDDHIGELTAERTVTQRISVERAGLIGVFLPFGTFDRANPVTLRLRLLPSAGDGDPIRTSEARVGAETELGAATFRFEPLAEGGGYMLAIESPDAVTGLAITVYRQPGQGLTVDGEAQPAMLRHTLLFSSPERA